LFFWYCFYSAAGAGDIRAGAIKQAGAFPSASALRCASSTR
jgi:hypothetical protein